MEDFSAENRSDTEPSNPRASMLGTWAVVAVLSAFLVAACIIAYLGWTSTDTVVPTSGYVAMALGVIFSVIVGVGLMALIFFSSRKGYDEPVVFLQEPVPHRDEVQANSQEREARRLLDADTVSPRKIANGPRSGVLE